MNLKNNWRLSLKRVPYESAFEKILFLIGSPIGLIAIKFSKMKGLLWNSPFSVILFWILALECLKMFLNVCNKNNIIVKRFNLKRSKTDHQKNYSDDLVTQSCSVWVFPFRQIETEPHLANIAEHRRGFCGRVLLWILLCSRSKCDLFECVHLRSKACEDPIFGPQMSLPSLPVLKLSTFKVSKL